MDVAVVIPVGSVDAALEPQVMSVLGQADVALREVVLSVNSSAADVVAAVGKVVVNVADGRVRIIDSSARRGAASARNAGARASTCPLIAFCDADDLVHEGWLHALVVGLETHDAVSGRVVDVFPEERMTDWYPPATPGGLNSFLGQPYLLTGNLAVRRDAFMTVGGFDETLTRCEDIAISWALVRGGFSIGYADGAVIDYRHRAGVMPMLRQYYLYGRGMSEVLHRFSTPPANGEWSAPSGVRALRPNGQRAARTTLVGTMRRGALAVGRLRGLVRFPRPDVPQDDGS
jgi:GT2 family glycosyltransferase